LITGVILKFSKAFGMGRRARRKWYKRYLNYLIPCIHS
jgi:hypothetical protein